MIVICFCFGFNKKQKYHNSIKLIKAYDDQHNTTPVVLYFDSKKKVDTYKASDFMSQKYPVFKDFLTAVYTKPDFKPNRTVDNMFITLYKKNQSFKDDIIEYFKRGYDVDIRDFRKLPDDIKQDIVQNEARFYMYRINELYTSYYLYHTVKAHGQLGHFIFALEDEV